MPCTQTTTTSTTTPTPGQSPEGRAAITQAFDDYVKALEPLYDQYGAFPHWAKVRKASQKERTYTQTDHLLQSAVQFLSAQSPTQHTHTHTKITHQNP